LNKKKNKKELVSLVLGLVYALLISLSFFFLGHNDRLYATLLLSCLLLVSLIVSTIKYYDSLTLFHCGLFPIIYLAIIVPTFIIENNLISYKVLSISEKLVHLGDKELEWFDPSKPLETNYFTKTFRLDTHPKKAKLRIYVKDVDPDFRNGPALVRINDGYSFYLNNLKPFSDISPKEEHKLDFQWAEQDIPGGFLKKGDNVLYIYVLATIYGLDDINFSKIELLYR
jgi:hypothetical protein